MVSVDMVGVGGTLYSVSYRGTDTATVDLILEVGEASGLDVRRLERGDISDHEPFALAGVPSAMLWRPDNPAYHGPGDDEVNSGLVVEVLRLV